MRTDSLKIKNFKKITSLFIMLFSFTYGYTQCSCSAGNTIDVTAGTTNIGTHTLGNIYPKTQTSTDLCIDASGGGTVILTGTIFMNGGTLSLCSDGTTAIEFSSTFNITSNFESGSGIVNFYTDVTITSAYTIKGFEINNEANLVLQGDMGITTNTGVTPNPDAILRNAAGATIDATGHAIDLSSVKSYIINNGDIQLTDHSTSSGGVLRNNSGATLTASGDVDRSLGETYNYGEMTVAGTLTLGGGGVNLYMTNGLFRAKTLSITSGIYNVDAGSCAVFYVDNVVGVTCGNTYNGEISIIDVSHGPDATACPSEANNAGSFKYSNFAGASTCAQILPVEFVNIYVIDNVLYWITAEEKDNEFFIIERSLDGQNFEAIGEVKGAGDSNYDIQYLFEDENPILQTVYYRIKQVDIDGKYSYSKVVTQKGKEVEIVLYPNPVYDNKVNISINNIESKAFTYEIISSIGQIILQENVLIQENIFDKQINTENLLKGIYLVKVKTQEDVIIQKMIIE